MAVSLLIHTPDKDVRFFPSLPEYRGERGKSDSFSESMNEDGNAGQF
jgi:hypothetical protein